MRGKHASAAERRRSFEDLERRTAEAECTAEKLARELADLRTFWGTRSAELIRQRDSVTMPALETANVQIADLKSDLGKAVKEKVAYQGALRRLHYILADFIIEKDFTPAEADSAIACITTEIENPLHLIGVKVPAHSLKAGRKRGDSHLAALNAVARRRGQLNAITERDDELVDELEGRYRNALQIRGER